MIHRLAEITDGIEGLLRGIRAVLIVAIATFAIVFIYKISDAIGPAQPDAASSQSSTEDAP